MKNTKKDAPAAPMRFDFFHHSGTVVVNCIMTIIFYIVLSPIAILRRKLGHDPMRRQEWKKNSDSVFVTRNHTYQAKELDSLS